MMDTHVSSRLMRRTWKDLVFYFPAIVIQGIVGLLIAAVLSKSFSPERYGNFVLAYGIHNLLFLVTGAWLGFSIIRLVPEYRQKRDLESLIFTFSVMELVLVISASFVGTTALALMHGRIDPELLRLICVALGGAVALSGTAAIQQIYRINGYPYRYSIVGITRVLGGIFIGTILIKLFDMGVVGFFVGLTVPSFVIVFWYLISKRKKFLAILSGHRFQSGVFWNSLNYSAPIVVMNMMALILGLSDRYLIKGFLSSYEVGVYTVGYMIASQGILLFHTILMTAAEPIAMTSFEEHGSETAMKYLSQIFRLYTLLAIPGLAGLCVMGEEIIQFVSTKEYLAALPVMGLVGAGTFFHGYTQILNGVFGFKKRTLIPMTNFILASMVNICLNILLIPRFGYIAAAWSTLCSYGMLFIITLVRSRTVIHFRFFHRYHWKALLGSGCMGLVLGILKDEEPLRTLGLVSSIILGIVVYGAFLLISKEIRYVDIRARALLLKASVSRLWCAARSSGLR